MNDVIRPSWPQGSILWAAATVAALTVFLTCASVASGASEPLAGGTTDLTMKKGFKKKLGRHNVKLRSWGSGKVRNRTVELGVSGGEIDTATGLGRLEHAGGFKFKHRKRTVPVTQLTIYPAGGAVQAKVAGARMKLGSLAGVSYSHEGLGVDIRSGKLRLSGKAAKRINNKLHIGRRVIKGGDVMSNHHSTAQVPGQPVPVPAPQAEPPAGPNNVVDVMTRNLYLGADLTPAILAASLEEFIDANGQILREVTHNDFPTRAQGLAQEILTQKPDLVGLQEVALWRTAPVNLGVLETGPSATTVRYDYLQELLDALNAGGTQYEVVVVQNEFDLEAPGDEDNSDGTGGPFGADINGRLTMRDVILARTGAGVETSNAKSGNFQTPLPIEISGQTVADHPRLDQDRRQRAREPSLPLRQHPSGGVQ